MRIVHTPARFYPDVGGVHNHIYYLAKELIKKKHQIKVICANEPKSEIVRLERIEIQRLPYLGKVANTNITPTLAAQLFREKYDILQTHMPTPWTADISTLVARIRSKPVFITIHNDLEKSGTISGIITKIYVNTIFRLTLAGSSKIIIVNPSWENAFKSTRHVLMRHKKKIITIPNAIDNKVFHLRSIRRTRNSILFVSILDEYHDFKGFEYLLAAMKSIIRKIPDAILTVVGEGSLKKQHQLRVAQEGLQKNVRFVGFKTQNELARIYAESEVFVLPSTHNEGFGIVLLEAMACGTPVVTTDIAGTAKEVKSNQAGIVVPPRNSERLAQAVCRILRDRHLRHRMSRQGVELVNRKYLWGEVAKEFEAAYEGELK